MLKMHIRKPKESVAARNSRITRVRMGLIRDYAEAIYREQNYDILLNKYNLTMEDLIITKNSKCCLSLNLPTIPTSPNVIEKFPIVKGRHIKAISILFNVYFRAWNICSQADIQMITRAHPPLNLLRKLMYREFYQEAGLNFNLSNLLMGYSAIPIAVLEYDIMRKKFSRPLHELVEDVDTIPGMYHVTDKIAMEVANRYVTEANFHRFRRIQSSTSIEFFIEFINDITTT